MANSGVTVVGGILTALQFASNMQRHYALANAELAKLAMTIIAEGRTEATKAEMDLFLDALAGMDDAARERIEEALNL